MTGSSGQEQEPRPASERDGWRVLSYMLGGMVLYGGLGWLVGHWTGITILFPLGMILGIVLSIVMIAFRYSRS
jgi:ATP synthase protein I